MNQEPQLTLLFDGACPICRREISWLNKKDRSGALNFVDISAKGFSAADYNKTNDALMARMHAVLPDGSLIDGVEVFRRAYDAVGLGWILWFYRLPVLRQLTDTLYSIFAKYRLKFRGHD